LAEVVHAHVTAEAVTATLPLPPAAGTDCADGEIVNLQGAMVIVPVALLRVR